MRKYSPSTIVRFQQEKMPYLKTVTEEDLTKTDYLQRGLNVSPSTTLGVAKEKPKKKA